MMRRTTARSLAGGALLAALAVAPLAAAADPQSQAAAEALFRDGRRLMSEGKLAEACPKFVAAQKLEPTVGTALNIGDCFEKAGKTASAWAGFDAARTLARGTGEMGRAAEAERRMKALDGKLSRLLLQAPPGGAPAGLEIRLDGQPIDGAALGTAIPVDPGEHALEMSSPSAKWRTTVSIGVGPRTETVRLPAPAEMRGGAAAPAAGKPWGAQRVAGLAVAGAGLAGVVVGAIFGVQAITAKSASNSGGHCDAQDFCDAQGKGLRADSLRAGNVSTVGFIAGGVALAGGVVLFLTAPSGAPRQAGGVASRLGLAVGPTGLRLVGRW
jgi:serine/threonine-protein kinase